MPKVNETVVKLQQSIEGGMNAVLKDNGPISLAEIVGTLELVKLNYVNMAAMQPPRTTPPGPIVKPPPGFDSGKLPGNGRDKP